MKWLLLFLFICTELSWASSAKFYSLDAELSLKNKHIILMGCPGSGKGTLAQFLKEQGRYYHFSLGDAVREEIVKESAIGLACKEAFATGNLISEKIAQALFEEHFYAALENGQFFIIDGMIQNQNYVDYFDQVIEKNGLSEHFSYIYLKVTPEIAKKRLQCRLICPSCHQVFAYAPTLTHCNHCLEALTTRVDDSNEKATEKRLNRFFKGTDELQATLLLIDNYRNRPNFLEIDAEQELNSLQALYEQLFL